MPIFNGGRIGSNNVPFTGTKSNDPNYSNVSLLLNGNGTNGSTTFTDSSSYGHTVTPVADAKISTAQNKFGGASIYLDGSGDCLSLPDDQSAFNFGTGDFTIECWIYWVGGAYGIVFSQRHAYDTNNTGMSWRIDDANDTIGFWHGNGLDGFGTPSNAISKNTWTHIALTRNGSIFTIWVNGQSQATNTITASMIYYPPVIGRSQGVLGEYLNAYLDDFRITKGVARYTANFTPPTAELPGGETGTFASGLWTGLEQCDAVRRGIWTGLSLIDSDYIALINANGLSDGSTSLNDDATSTLVTSLTCYGTCDASTAVTKNSSASIEVGSGDSGVLVNFSEVVLDDTEWTLEMWFYPTAGIATYNAIWGSAASSKWLEFNGTYLRCRGWNTSIQSTTSFTTNQWYHVALEKDSSDTVRLYVNGILESSQSGGDNWTYNYGRIGNSGNLSRVVQGYYDDIRLSKVARYNGNNFTPPTSLLT